MVHEQDELDNIRRTVLLFLQNHQEVPGPFFVYPACRLLTAPVLYQFYFNKSANIFRFFQSMSQNLRGQQFFYRERQLYRLVNTPYREGVHNAEVVCESLKRISSFAKESIFCLNVELGLHLDTSP